MCCGPKATEMRFLDGFAMLLIVRKQKAQHLSLIIHFAERLTHHLRLEFALICTTFCTKTIEVSHRDAFATKEEFERKYLHGCTNFAIVAHSYIALIGITTLKIEIETFGRDFGKGGFPQSTRLLLYVFW